MSVYNVAILFCSSFAFSIPCTSYPIRTSLLLLNLKFICVMTHKRNQFVNQRSWQWNSMTKVKWSECIKSREREWKEKKMHEMKIKRRKIMLKAAIGKNVVFDPIYHICFSISKRHKVLMFSTNECKHLPLTWFSVGGGFAVFFSIFHALHFTFLRVETAFLFCVRVECFPLLIFGKSSAVFFCCRSTVTICGR